MTNPTSACPDIGAWRAWLDREDETPELEGHLAACPGCRRIVADLGDDAAQVRAAFALLSPGQSSLPSAADVAVARERLGWQRGRTLPGAATAASREPIPAALARISTPWRLAASGVAAALVLSVLMTITPEGRALASGFLAQFRSQQVMAVEVTPQTQGEIMKTLNSLGNLGTVKMPTSALRAGAGLVGDVGAAQGAQAGVSGPRGAGRAPQPPAPVSLAEASHAVGFSLETPDPATLPSGLDKTPTVRVTPASEVRFTFDKTRAAAYFKSTGHAQVTLPDKFDGASLVVSIPAAALLQYGGSGARDTLVVGQAGELVVDVEGKVTLDEMRDFLLGLPGMPPSVVTQLRTIRSWNQTLPIPVPVDQVNWQSTRFNGHEGLLLNDNSGVASAAIWYDGGHMYGLAGSLKATELKHIADGLAVR